MRLGAKQQTGHSSLNLHSCPCSGFLLSVYCSRSVCLATVIACKPILRCVRCTRIQFNRLPTDECANTTNCNIFSFPLSRFRSLSQCRKQCILTAACCQGGCQYPDIVNAPSHAARKKKSAWRVVVAEVAVATAAVASAFTAQEQAFVNLRDQALAATTHTNGSPELLTATEFASHARHLRYCSVRWWISHTFILTMLPFAGTFNIFSCFLCLGVLDLTNPACGRGIFAGRLWLCPRHALVLHLTCRCKPIEKCCNILQSSLAVCLCRVSVLKPRSVVLANIVMPPWRRAFEDCQANTFFWSVWCKRKIHFIRVWKRVIL